jgi:hypothetical protein
MGYYISNIATVSETNSDKVQMADRPNFVSIKPSQRSNDTSPYICGLSIVSSYFSTDDVGDGGKNEFPTETVFSFTEVQSGTKHNFSGTNNSEKVGGNIFMLTNEAPVLSQNILRALKTDSWINSNFDISYKLNYGETTDLEVNSTLFIQPKTCGARYAYNVNADSSFLYVAGNPQSNTNTDTIDSGGNDTEIQCDVFTGSTFLGLENPNTLGKYIITLSTMYNTDLDCSIDVNSITNKLVSYSNSFLGSDDWVDAGTCVNYKYLLKRSNDELVEPFYLSENKYALNAYHYPLGTFSFDKYIYKNNISGTATKIHFLTTNESREYVEGQSEYVNFILFDELHGLSTSSDSTDTFKLQYQYFTNGLENICMSQSNAKLRTNMNIVNTCKIYPNISEYEKMYGKVICYFDVYLVYNDSIVSYPIRYRVLPKCLSENKSFAFLNKLGGWDCFNFNGTTQNDYSLKSTNTIYKSFSSNVEVSDEFESVESKVSDITYTVTSSVIGIDTIEWLKEMAYAKAIYELSSMKYIIIDEMKVSYKDSDVNGQVSMKYHYSDSINNIYK